MASPEEIRQFVIQSEQFAHRNFLEIDKLIDNQRLRESEIIKRTNSHCPLEKLDDRTIRAEDIKKALQEGYGDANVLRSLMCLNNSLAMFPNGTSLGRSHKIREYIRGLRQIGSESVEGYAMVADIKGKMNEGKDLLVVKSPRRIDAALRANQIHEYFIGVFGTNRMRSLIPNFAFILGLLDRKSVV